MFYRLYKDLLQARGFVVRREGEVFYADGESTHMFITRKYSPWYGESVELHGSIHKFYTGGNNATTFTYVQVIATILKLKDFFCLSWEDHITRLEAGFNIKVDEPAENVIRDAILYGNRIGKNVNEDYDYDEHCVTWMFKEKKKKDDQEGLGCLGHEVMVDHRDFEECVEGVEGKRKFKNSKGSERKTHCLKMYVKAADIVRFEDKAFRMDRRIPFIKTLGDLTKLENFIKCQDMLLKAMNKIVFVPLSLAKSLPPEQSKEWLLKRELSEWNRLRLTSAPYVVSREKARLYRELVKLGGKDRRKYLLAGMRAEADLMLQGAETATDSRLGLQWENVAGATSACDATDLGNVGEQTSSPGLNTTNHELRGVEGQCSRTAPLQASSASTAHMPAADPTARSPPFLVRCNSLFSLSKVLQVDSVPDLAEGRSPWAHRFQRRSMVDISSNPQRRLRWSILGRGQE